MEDIIPLKSEDIYPVRKVLPDGNTIPFIREEDSHHGKRNSPKCAHNFVRLHVRV